jgi:cell division septum initiation protein DivIVA
MRQPATMRDAKSMVKERWLDRRVEKLSEENDKLRDAVEDLRHELDAEHGRSKETLSALSKSRRRPGRMKWLVLAGGAYVLGAKAGRARFEQMKGWVRSMAQQGSNGETNSGTTVPTTTTTPSSRSSV